MGNDTRVTIRLSVLLDPPPPARPTEPSPRQETLNRPNQNAPLPEVARHEI